MSPLNNPQDMPIHLVDVGVVRRGLGEFPKVCVQLAMFEALTVTSYLYG